MTKREVELYFVNKKSQLVNSFIIKDGARAFNNGKKDKKGRFSLWFEAEKKEVYFNTLDELWNYELDGKTIGEFIKNMKVFVLTGEE